VKSEIRNIKSKIAIVGAGPAGTSLAIRLAKKGFEITLIEREKFPRHKLCGEFISPECLEHFRELDVLNEMLVRGGDRISETIFYSENGSNVSVPSKWFGGNLSGALSLSRAEMDFRLMEKAKNLGVEVLEEASVVGLLLDGESVSGVKIRTVKGEVDELFSDITVDATGRGRVLSKFAKKEVFRKGLKNHRKQKDRLLVGFKAHFKNVNLEVGRCEIYFFRGGYGGLSYVEDGFANHCFLIEADVVKEFNGNADQILREVIFKNERAGETMKNAERVFEWLAVSVDGFGTKNLNPAPNLFSVGDAAAFIDPFTGSGMLMALESSEIMAGLIANDSSGASTIAEKYALSHQVKFNRRMQICSVIRKLSFTPIFVKAIIFALSLSKKTTEILARMTRSTEAGKVSKV